MFIHRLIFISILITNSLGSDDSEKPKDEGLDERTIAQIDFGWIREQLGFVKDMISDGLSMNELEFLKSYLIGFSEEEAEELEKEIEDILQQTDDVFTFGNFTLDLSSNITENEESATGNIVTDETDENRTKWKYLNQIWLNMANVKNRFHKDTKNGSGSKTKNNSAKNEEDKEVMIEDKETENEVRTPNSLVIGHTEVRGEHRIIAQTLVATNKDDRTSTITTTILIPQTYYVSEIETLVKAPNVVTERDFLTKTKVVTKEEEFPTTVWTTKRLDVHETQIDVHGSFEVLTQSTPAYVTYSSPSLFTKYDTVTRTQLYYSTMVLTDTKYIEIPVTVTQTKNPVVDQVVTETIFEKMMVTKSSTLFHTSTTTKQCKKNFFKILKNPFS